MEASNKDQTDDILREKLHALEIDAPLFVFEKVQQKRERKYRAMWLFSSAATLLLAIMILLLFTEPNKMQLTTKVLPATKMESSSTPKQQVLPNSNTISSLASEKIVAKEHTPKFSKHSADPAYLNITPDQTITEKEDKATSEKEYIPIAANQTPDPQKSLRLLPEIGSDRVLQDSLQIDTSWVTASKPEQAMVPDSISLPKPIKLQNGKWFVGIAYTQNLYNSQYAQNSESLLVFGDSSQGRDKPLSSWRFDGYVGRMLGANWNVSAGMCILKTRYATITKAEQESPSVNLSISNSNRDAWQSKAAYFDESLTYISLPLEVGYQLKVGKWNLHAGIGPQFTYLMRTKSYKASINKGEAPDQVQDASNARFNKFSFALQQKCMISYPVIHNCSVGLGIQAMQSFKNTYQSENNSDSKVYMLGLQLGIKYYLP
jgi:hypothetical protein